MHIQVDASADPARVELIQPDDFRAFDVIINGTVDPSGALESLGPTTDDGEHVFVEQDRLKSLPGARPDDPQWLEGFEQMAAYAADHGWTDDAGRIRAHVVQD